MKNGIESFLYDAGESALNAERKSAEIAKDCLKALNSFPMEGNRKEVSLRNSVEEMLAVHLWIIAGVCHGRSAFNFEPVEEPLPDIYALKPWKCGFFVKEALLYVIKNTTLHLESFEALFQLIVECKSAIKESYDSGAVAYPQGEELQKKAIQTAKDYLAYSSEVEIPNRGFRNILEKWMKDSDPQIAEFAEKIKLQFCT